MAFDVASGTELLIGSDLPPYPPRITYSPDIKLLAEDTRGGTIYLSENRLPSMPTISSATHSPTAILEPYMTPITTPTIGPGSHMFSIGDLRTVDFVPTGPFQMGASSTDASADPDEKPQHAVSFDAILIDQYEVTHGEYALSVQAGSCNPPRAVDRNGFAYDYAAAIQEAPVVNVSWEDATDYCVWAGKRVSSEAEWERAARGTDGRLYPWVEDSDTFQTAWYCADCIRDVDYPDVLEDFSRPITVGNFPESASPFGAFYMAGNVWECVYDWYASDTYSQTVQANPTEPDSGDLRVVRGGSRTVEPIYLRITYHAARDLASLGSTWVFAARW